MKKRPMKKPSIKQVTATFVTKLFDQLECPSGFAKELELCDTTKPASAWDPHRHKIHIANEDGSIKMRMEFVPGRADEYYLGTGHTDFKTSRGSYTFDRTGVEDSFYIPNEADLATTLKETIAKQVEKVHESRARHDNSEPVPGLRGAFLVTPEKKAEIASKLKAGKGHNFIPSGFGTGYQLSTRRYLHSQPNQTLAAFFDMPVVYVSEMDCD